MSKILFFPGGVKVVISAKSNTEVTEDFREKIRAAFKHFIKGSTKEFLDCNKLLYIKEIRDFNFEVNPKELIKGDLYCEYESEGKIGEGFFNIQKTETLIEVALAEFARAWTCWYKDEGLDSNKIAVEFVTAAIQEVINYKED